MTRLIAAIALLAVLDSPTVAQDVPPTSTLDPQAQRVLDLIAASPPPPAGSDPVAVERGTIAASAAFGGPIEPVDTVTELTAPGGAGPVRARLYRPAGAARLLVWAHGGSFVAGSLDSHDRPLRMLANRSGWAMLALDYRLAPEHPFPAAVDDVYAALDWAAQGGAGFTPAALAVGGDSAGGNVAAAVALMARDRRGPPIDRQILVYPNTDLTLADRPSWRTNEGRVLTRAAMAADIARYVPDAATRGQGYASPLLARDVTRLPPATIVTAGADPLHDEGEAYGDRLAAAGVRVERSRWPGMIHGFFQMAGAIDASRRLIDELAQTLKVTQRGP